MESIELDCGADYIVIKDPSKALKSYQISQLTSFYGFKKISQSTEYKLSEEDALSLVPKIFNYLKNESKDFHISDSVQKLIEIIESKNSFSIFLTSLANSFFGNPEYCGSMLKSVFKSISMFILFLIESALSNFVYSDLPSL